jgi:hypothetical protein
MAIQYNANYIETMPFSDVCVQFNLAAAVAQSYTVAGPSGAKYQAYFEYASNSNVFVRNNATAAAPVGNTHTSQPYSEFKPRKRYVTAGDVLSLVTPDTTAFVGLSLRQIQGS